MSALSFYRRNARWLAAGLICTAASSFGQTYFISLFAGRIMETYGLSDGQWGTLYTAATLTSAALLVQAGRLADTMALNRLAAAVLAAFALIALGMALNASLILLFALVAGLRFCGQGMISHIGITAVARWFRAYRGRALAVAGLGYSLGEAVLPSIVVALIASIGWRGTWAAAAVFIAVVLIPVLWWFLSVERQPEGDEAHRSGEGLDGRHWTRNEAVRRWLFWALAPAVLTPSFIGTVIFFHQVHIADAKGWDLAVMALGYPAYALTTVLALFAAGRLVDGVGAARLLPVLLLPEAAAMALIGPGQGVMTWHGVLILLGMTQGMVSATSGALWPELYGTRHIGAIRAATVAIMVVGTAIGPGITGLLIDAGIAFPEQGIAMALWSVALSAALLPVSRWIRGRLPRP